MKYSFNATPNSATCYSKSPLTLVGRHKPTLVFARMKRLRSLFPLLLLIIVGMVLLANGALDRFQPTHLAEEQLRLHELIMQHPLKAGLIHIVVMTLAIATGIPGAVAIIFAGGMLFGVVIGTALSITGTVLGALILFMASRNAFSTHSGKQAPAMVERLRKGYLAHPFSYTLFLRLVPFFPFGAVTVALAWLRCPMWLFLSATTLGGTVMLGFETALGAGLAKNIADTGAVKLDLLTQPNVFLPMIALGLLALVPVLISRFRTRRT